MAWKLLRMRKIVLPLPDLRKESFILLGCALFACALNVYAIVAFKTPWTELVTSWPWVLGLTIVSYGVLCACRIFKCGVLYVKKIIIRQPNLGRKS
jgi:hypothetical protein